MLLHVMTQVIEQIMDFPHAFLRILLATKIRLVVEVVTDFVTGTVSKFDLGNETAFSPGDVADCVWCP